MIRFFCLTLVLAASTTLGAQAQKIESFVQRLEYPQTDKQISIVQHGDASIILSTLQQQSIKDKINGYRVRIFFDNSQLARVRAKEAISRFNELYPGIPAYMVYENPYFKVSVGNCVTAEEAITLWGNVKSNFDRAFVIREDIPLSTLRD